MRVKLAPSSRSHRWGFRRTYGFVQRVPTGAEEPFRLKEKNDPKTVRSVDPAEVGGLHHSSHELFFGKAPTLSIPIVQYAVD